MRKAVILACVAALTVAVGTSVADAHSRTTKSLTLTLWAPPGNFVTPAAKNLIAGYEKRTGNKIQVVNFPNPFEQNVLAKWASGSKPDLLLWHGIGNWLVALNPTKTLLPLDGMPFIKKTKPGILPNSVTYKKHVYAAIVGFPDVDGMFYNAQLFAQYGLSVPHSFSELLQLCQTIKQKAPGIAPIYEAAGDKWPLQIEAFMMWNDAIKENPNLLREVNEHKAKFSDPVFVNGIKTEQTLLNNGCYNSDVNTGTYANEQAALMTGKAFMFFQGTWVVPGLVQSYGLQAVNQTLRFTGLSMDSNVASWQTTANAEVFYVPKTGNQSKENAAKAFISYATGAGYGKFLQQSGSFPILKGYKARSNVPYALRQAYHAFSTDSVAQFQQTLQATYGAFETYLQNMILGQWTPQQVGNELQQQFEQNAHQIGLPGF